MKIKRIIYQHRRDFHAEYECEHCGWILKTRGYDDAYFHEVVIPNMKCKRCGNIAMDDYRPYKTKYSEDQQV